MGEFLRKVWLKIATFARWYWLGDGWQEGGRKPWVRRVLAILFALWLPIPVLLILIFRFVPVPATPQMILSFVTGQGAHQSWRAYSDISPYLGRAVIGSEDQQFCFHNGFDWKDINDAWRAHQRHPRKTLRGASTISQQARARSFCCPCAAGCAKARRPI